MNKNVSGQKISVFVFNSTTNAPITGDAANITVYVSQNDGTATALAAASVSELSSTNAAGYYFEAVSQSESNADKLTFSAKSSTSNAVCICIPDVVYTQPANASKLTIDSGGGVNATQIAGTAPGAGGRGLGNFDADYYNNNVLQCPVQLNTAATVDGKTLLFAGANAATTFAALTVTGAFSINGTSTVAQTGDAFARIGANGGGLTVLATAANLSALQTSVNNLNNLSALAVIYGPTQMEVPATGSIAYPLTMLVKDAEGHLLDLSAAPTVTAANAAGTSRSGNLSAVTHAATGQYTFTYTVASSAAQEGISITGSGTASSDSTSRVAILSTAVVSVDTIATLAAIKAKTDNLPASPASTGDVTGAEATIVAAVGTPMQAGANAGLSNGTITLIQTGLATGQNVTDASNTTQSAIITHGDANWEGGGGSGGSGAFTVTVPVTNTSNATLQNVLVALTLNGTPYRVRTNAEGLATFNLDAGTYTRAATYPGYLFTGDSMEISESATLATIVMAAESLPPAVNPSQSRCYLVCYDQQGNPDPMAKIQIQLTSPASAGAWPKNVLTVECDSSGNIIDPVDGGEGVLLALDVPYRAKRGTATKAGDGVWTAFTPNSGSFVMPPVLGFDV